MSLPRRLGAFLLTLALFLGVILPCGLFQKASAAGKAGEATVLFTHDLHSHFLPQQTEDGRESGGYARLKTVLDGERTEHPNAVTVDGGDFSIGSLIQTLYTTQAAELRTMGALGYDATTAGNHEFDHTGTGFAQMLDAAVKSGEKTPYLLMANYKPADENPNQLDIQRSMAAYGVRDSVTFERGGVVYGIFGLMGEDADDCAPTSGFTLGDRVKNAQRCVDALKAEGAEFIICLSHGGTNENSKRSEDERLAEKVSGIDLIVSGHSHTTLAEPIVVGETYIVSAGPYCENLGSITLTWTADGTKTLKDYHLTAIDEDVDEDETISALVEGWKSQVSSGYLSRYNLGFDQVLTTSKVSLPTPLDGDAEDVGLGNLVADAYRWAASELTDDGGEPAIAVAVNGVLRSGLFAGDITTSQAFDVLSMGVGEDGTSGFPLVEVYLTGKELKAVAEVDASISAVMPTAQLFVSGMNYSYNVHRMFLNRVTEIGIPETSGTARLEDDALYRVVTGMYSAQMLGTVKNKSLGLLSIEPKFSDGSAVEDFADCVLYDKNGNELKEWYALAAYLQTFGDTGIPSRYAADDGRKIISRSWSPIQLLKYPNWITLVTILALALAVGLVVLLVRRLAALGRRSRYGGRKRRFGH